MCIYIQLAFIEDYLCIFLLCGQDKFNNHYLNIRGNNSNKKTLSDCAPSYQATKYFLFNGHSFLKGAYVDKPPPPFALICLI